MAMTGKQLLPLSSSMQGGVSQLAWQPPGEPPNNLVRMRSQSLGQSAPSLTAGLRAAAGRQADWQTGRLAGRQAGRQRLMSQAVSVSTSQELADLLCPH
ncbi:unnamed protein product [Coregonus sp. 'balchen']|nr:unnamed protein product [Coregonus sp. 'balchen']